jgi:hypothetical protein
MVIATIGIIAIIEMTVAEVETGAEIAAGVAAAVIAGAAAAVPIAGQVVETGSQEEDQVREEIGGLEEQALAEAVGKVD